MGRELAPCCEAEKTTFDGLTLECERDRGHVGLHLDIDRGLWWAGYNNRSISADGLTLGGGS